MLSESVAFSSFSVDDIDRARDFYRDVLGLVVLEENGLLWLELTGGHRVLAYPKRGHVPAAHTILHFPVDDIESTVDGLAARGVRFEHYEGTPSATDDKGVFRGGGPLIAWFTDPAGNVLAVIET